MAMTTACVRACRESLLHRAGGVVLDRLLSDAEGLADATVDEPEGGVLQHLALMRREVVLLGGGWC